MLATASAVSLVLLPLAAFAALAIILPLFAGAVFGGRANGSRRPSKVSPWKMSSGARR